MSDNNPNFQNNISFNNSNKSVSSDVNLNDGAQNYNPNSEAVNPSSEHFYLPVSGKSVSFSEKEFQKKITASMEAQLNDSLQEFMAFDEKTGKGHITDMRGFMAAQREQRNFLIKIAFPDLASDFGNLPIKDVKVLEDLIKKADVTGSEKALRTQERNKMLEAKYGDSVLSLPEKGLERLSKNLPNLEKMSEEELLEFAAKLNQTSASPKA